LGVDSGPRDESELEAAIKLLDEKTVNLSRVFSGGLSSNAGAVRSLALPAVHTVERGQHRGARLVDIRIVRI
jgi:hypothetical protein